VLSAYRPAVGDDIEWSFPVSCKRYAFTRPLPETAAIMTVIDREPTDCLMALHDSSFCGAHFYLSDDDEILRGDLLAAVAAGGLPRHLGELEAPYIEPAGRGGLPAVRPGRRVRLSGELAASTRQPCSSRHELRGLRGRRLGRFSVIAEVPLFSTPLIATRATRASPGAPPDWPGSSASRATSTG